MEPPKVYADANRLGHYGEMLPQFPCLVLRVRRLAWFWQGPNFLSALNASGRFMVCYLLFLIFVCSWKHPESSSVPAVSGLVLVCCLLLLFLDRLWKCSEFPSKLTSLIMPRLRGTSLRGSHSGNRG